MKKEIRKHMAEIGAKGGRAGKGSAAKAESARRANAARWGKVMPGHFGGGCDMRKTASGWAISLNLEIGQEARPERKQVLRLLEDLNNQLNGSADDARVIEYAVQFRTAIGWNDFSGGCFALEHEARADYERTVGTVSQPIRLAKIVQYTDTIETTDQ